MPRCIPAGRSVVIPSARKRGVLASAGTARRADGAGPHPKPQRKRRPEHRSWDREGCRFAGSAISPRYYGSWGEKVAASAASRHDAARGARGGRRFIHRLERLAVGRCVLRLLPDVGKRHTGSNDRGHC